MVLTNRKFLAFTDTVCVITLALFFRNCIGKSFAMSEIKITICKALQRFRFYVDDDCPEPEILPSLTLKAKNGIYLKMVPI